MSYGNVLLVEDDPELLKLFQFTLKRVLGEAAITTASSSTEAVAILRDYTPQVTVVDPGMSQLDGSDLIHFILSQPHLDSTHIVIVTAVPLRLASAGLDRVSDVLTKPVRPRELEYVVSHLLGLHTEKYPHMSDNAV